MSTAYHHDDGLKDAIKESIVEVTAYYAGGRLRKEGGRSVFRCPRCHKETVHVNQAWVSGAITGCWNGDCSLPRTQDALGLIAEMEGLDNRGDFKQVLEHGASILGLQYPTGNSREQPADNGTSSAASGVKSGAREPDPPEQKPEPDPELDDRVYRRMLSVSGLSPEVWQRLLDRGLAKDTILDAGIGYLPASKGGPMIEALYEEFGHELARVPGFYPTEKAKNGYWSNFAGKELVLFPYYDGHGLVSTIEGRVMFGKEDTQRYKYLSLTGSGSHLYVFPGMGFENIEAFCEGLLGAMVAFQDGICAASIQGFRRYRESGGRYPLKQLQAVDFAGRTVVYIPDMDNPPKREVAEEAPEAARWLVERQNGRPLITLLPPGKDLDEFLLTMERPSRRAAFDRLVKERSLTVESYEARLHGATQQRTSEAQAANKPGPAHHPGPQEAATRNPRPQQNAETLPEPETATGPAAESQTGARRDHRGGEPVSGPGQVGTEAQTEAQTSEGAQREQPAAATGLTGEEFYKAGFEYPADPPDPDEAPDPRAAIFGKDTADPGQESLGTPAPDKLATPATDRSPLNQLGAALELGLELTALWAVLYALALVVIYLSPLAPVDGLWWTLAVMIAICAALRARKNSRQRRFLAGTLKPGAK